MADTNLVRYVVALDRLSAELAIGTLFLECDTSWDMPNVYHLRYDRYLITVTPVRTSIYENDIVKVHDDILKEKMNNCKCVVFWDFESFSEWNTKDERDRKESIKEE